MEKTKPKLREKVLRTVMAALIALTGVVGIGTASVEKAYAATGSLSSVTWQEAKPQIEKHMGTPYVWGGRSTSGWDCSGFVSYVMHDIYGTSWPGGSWGNSGTDAIASFCSDYQVASGSSDSTYNAQFAAGTVKPGDIIIFYNASGSTVHAAIAGDNATVYHAWYEGFGTGNCRFDYMWGIDGGHGKTYASYKVYRGLATEGWIDLQKSSSNKTVTNDNDCYSLKGATYGIYASSADAKAGTGSVGTLKTDASGYAKSGALEPGTYYVSETKAPAGYALDTHEPYKVIVKGGETTHVNGGSVTDRPLTDPVAMLVGKVDASTSASLPQGSASLEGAQFTVAFYGGQFDSESQAKSAGVANRIWVFQTDSDGFCYLSDEYKVSGPALYYQSDGKTATLPLGTAFITETKAPAGYNLDDGNGGTPETFAVHITDKGAKGESVYSYNSPEIPDTVKRGDYRLFKEVPTTNDDENQELTRIPVEGVQFQIINANTNTVVSPETKAEVANGEVVCTIVTDENGIATTRDVRPEGWNGALSYGTYIVHEVIPDDVAAAYEAERGIQLVGVEDWQITISKDKQYDPLQIVANHIPQTPIRIEKVDATTGKAIPLATSFQLYDGAGNLVTYNDRMNEKTIDTWTTLEGGHVTLPMKLDAGTYTLVEVQAPDGYVLSDEPVSFTVDDYRTWDDPIVVTFEDQPIRAEIQIIKVDADDNAVPVAGATYCVEAAEDVVTGDGTLRFAKGENIGYFETDGQGMAEIDGLYLGSYIAYETKSPEGWALDTEEHQVCIQSQGQSVPIVVESLTLMDEGTDLLIAKSNAYDEETPVAGATFHIRQVEAVKGNEGISYEDIEDGFTADCTTGEDGTALIDHMPHGTFVVEETAAPAGYILGEDCSAIVKVDDQGFIGLAEEDSQFSHELVLPFANVPVTLDISKVDLTGGFELDGAELVLKDQAGEVVDQWTSTGVPHRISPIVPGKYTLAETVAPQGYLLSSETVEIEVLETGDIQTAEMTNDYTKVDISKTDIATGKELPGATLQVIDAQGNVIEKWVSEDKPHRIDMLEPGDYVLREITAPDGYEVAEDVAFTVDATGEIQTVVMKDAATPGTPGKGYDKTGVDLAPIFALIAAGIAAAGGLIGYGAHKRRKSKKEEETEDGILDSEEV